MSSTTMAFQSARPPQLNCCLASADNTSEYTSNEFRTLSDTKKANHIAAEEYLYHATSLTRTTPLGPSINRSLRSRLLMSHTFTGLIFPLVFRQTALALPKISARPRIARATAFFSQMKEMNALKTTFNLIVLLNHSNLTIAGQSIFENLQVNIT